MCMCVEQDWWHTFCVCSVWVCVGRGGGGDWIREYTFYVCIYFERLEGTGCVCVFVGMWVHF